MTETRPTIRLDKWLWQARFFKTRGIAARMVSAGHVRVSGIPASKPARAVGTGDVLTFPQGQAVRVVRIVALGERRGPAPEAQALYEDLTPEQPESERNPGFESGERPTRKGHHNLPLPGPDGTP